MPTHGPCVMVPVELSPKVITSELKSAKEAPVVNFTVSGTLPDAGVAIREPYVDCEPQRSAIAERVCKPTTPQPVDRGSPKLTTLCCACHFCTAACVSAPKYDVTVPAKTPS